MEINDSSELAVGSAEAFERAFGKASARLVAANPKLVEMQKPVLVATLALGVILGELEKVCPGLDRAEYDDGLKACVGDALTNVEKRREVWVN